MVRKEMEFGVIWGLKESIHNFKTFLKFVTKSQKIEPIKYSFIIFKIHIPRKYV
jgi:hypothetical protein